MPSDVTPDGPVPEGRVRECLDALEGARQPFRSALATTVEALRARAGPSGGPAEVLHEESAALGAFAQGRVDPGRFSALRRRTRPPEPPTVERAHDALRTLRDVAAHADDLAVLRVPAGRDLREAVADRLADVGRAFGAARVAAALRAGTFDEARHGPWLASFSFAAWNAAERALAPPLVVACAGADVDAPALAAFLDGRQRIVLVPDGPCAPAPLARLIAPRTWVGQVAGPADLAGLLAHDGPGIAARFVHDPAAPAGTPRLRIDALPAQAPRRAVGATSVVRQVEQLELLQALSAPPAAPPDSAPAAKPAERLAAWLLAQAASEEP